jgi:hypothetical protein
MTLLNKAPLTIIRVIKTSEHNSALSLTLVNKTPMTIRRVIQTSELNAQPLTLLNRIPQTCHCYN